MTLDEFLGALVRLDCDPRPTAPGKWKARCPSHGGRSLYVSVGERVDWVANCFGGCTFDEVITATQNERDELPKSYEPPPPEALPSESSLNITRRSLTPAVASAVQKAKGWSRPTLDAFGIGYADKRLVIPAYERGKLAQVYRYSPNGVEPKTRALKNRPRPMYHNPSLGAMGDVPLWIVEGEPDVLSAHELGLWAVGVPGVQGWRYERVQAFTGRSVRVCMDCDRQGREAAYRIFMDLAGIVADIRVVDLWPERDDGYDLTDFLIDARKRGDLAGARAVVRYWQERG